MPSPIAINELERAHLQSARVLDKGASPAAEKDTVEVVISLPREEAQRLFPNGFNPPQPDGPSSPAPPSPPRRDTRSGGTTPAAPDDSPLSPSISTTRTSAVPPPPPPLKILDPRIPYELQSPPALDATTASFLEMERSYTNAFHRTLSLFVDDKTFSSPALRAAVVGYLESATTTVLEVLPLHNHLVPDHLRQEIENHVNLVKTVLQRGGVFAEDYLRNRLKKLAAHIPRLEAALLGRPAADPPNGRSRLSRLPQSAGEHVSGDPYTTSPQLVSSEGYQPSHQPAVPPASVAPTNGRHQHIQELLNGPAPPSSNASSSRPGPAQIAIPPHNPGRGKTTFVPPSLVPSQGPPPPVRPDDGSPPPILAPFDPRPNPMACLFCRQRKIRCIGHKPHPCEICVKRGFVCSYDWISRRGKRKPKGQDGGTLEQSPGTGGITSVEHVSAITNSPTSAGGTVASVTPTSSMGGPDAGAVPQFAFTYHGILVGPPPHGVLSPQQFVSQPSPAGYPATSPTGAPNPEGGFPIDPSLVDHSSPQQPPTSGRRKGRGSKGSLKEACKSCQEQHVKCEASSAPGICASCLKGDRDCSWGSTSPIWQTARQQPSAKPSSPLSTPISAVSTSTSTSTIPPPTPSTENGMELDEPQDGSAGSHSRKRSVSAMSIDTNNTFRDAQQPSEKVTGSAPGPKLAAPIKKKQKVSHPPDDEIQEGDSATRQSFNDQSQPSSPVVAISSAMSVEAKQGGAGGGITREVDNAREDATRLSTSKSPSP